MCVALHNFMTISPSIILVSIHCIALDRDSIDYMYMYM